MDWTQMDPLDALVLTGAACLALLGTAEWLTKLAVDRIWRKGR